LAQKEEGKENRRRIKEGNQSNNKKDVKQTNKKIQSKGKEDKNML
jgi:hypothetical protein